ncbi:retrovirus-related pol polyprotein LINE-1 [Tanacetum coccineum]
MCSFTVFPIGRAYEILAAKLPFILERGANKQIDLPPACNCESLLQSAEVPHELQGPQEEFAVQWCNRNIGCSRLRSTGEKGIAVPLITQDASGDRTDIASPRKHNRFRGLTGETNSSSLEGLVKITGKESIQWGVGAGMYSGLTYGLREIRGVHDWRNSAVAGAITGAGLALTSDNPSQDKIVQFAITGAAVSTAANILTGIFYLLVQLSDLVHLSFNFFSPLVLFTLILDELSREIQESISWCMIFADDIVLIAESAEELNNKIERWREALEDNGLQVSREKTEYLRCDFGRYGVVHQEVDVRIGDRILQPKESFRYLGSVIHRSGRIDEDVAHRIGVECWPITKAQANRVEVAELRMLRWTCGKTMVDMILNGVFRAGLDVDSIIDKMREGRLR